MSLTTNCNLVLLTYKSHVNWYKYVRSWERHLSNQSGKVILNPLVEQQKPFKEPLFPESDLVFIPSEKDVEKAQQLFVPAKNHVIKYCKGVYDPSQVPSHKKTEIAFLGRSNVGKSSLIKELLKAAKVQVRTSKTPGHTKLVNFFEVGNAFMLVDMPGYGYRQPENFERSAEGYLNKSKRLSMTFLLVDSSVGLQPADYIAIDMLNEFGLPFTFVLTKYDKAGKRALYSTLVDLRETMDKKAPTCFPQPFLVSSIKSLGISLLKTFIAYITNTLETTR